MDKMLKKIVLFESINRAKVESGINETYQTIMENKFTYIDSKVWTEIKGDKVCWCGSVEFEAKYEEATGKELISERDKEIRALRNFNLNLDNALKDIGYNGAKAFVVQNQLDIPIGIPYHEILDRIEEQYNFDRVTPISEFSPEVELVEVNIKLDNTNEG